MKLWKKIALPFLAVGLLTSATSADGRHPNQSERQRIERALTSAGYLSWGEIELDRDFGRRIWEVDDARHKNGQRYDLELDASTLKIINRERD